MSRARRRAPVLGAVVVLAALVVALLGRDDPTYPDPLDPANPGPDGARAVARVLDDAGIRVDVARGAGALADALAGNPDATGAAVLVTGAQELGPATATQLRRLTAGRPLVVAGADIRASEALDLPGPPQRTDPGALGADCSDPRFRGLTIDVDSAAAVPAAGCFPAEGGSALALEDDVAVLGAAGLLTNDQVLRADNAAVALRLAGGRDRLVWYVPDLRDLDGGPGVGLRGLLPPWLLPSAWLAGLAGLAAVIWRGRRLGPVVREPIPVQVRAVETTLGRGRLYHRARARGHAAGALRRGSRRRAARTLRLPDGPDDEAALVTGVARATGRDPADVRRLLGSDAPPPEHDEDLTTLARALARLDGEVSTL